MRYAVPCVNGKLSMHFGHCQEFVLVDTDDEKKTITGSQSLVPPPHEPGVLPQWLHEQGANVIIAGGMGTRAQQLFTANDITVITGAPAGDPEELVSVYMNGALETGDNACDH